jgi:hypothetical protein
MGNVSRNEHQAFQSSKNIMTDSIPPAVEERIDNFCKQLALALRRIKGPNSENSTIKLPKPINTNQDEDSNKLQSGNA